MNKKTILSLVALFALFISVAFICYSLGVIEAKNYCAFQTEELEKLRDEKSLLYHGVADMNKNIDLNLTLPTPQTNVR